MRVALHSFLHDGRETGYEEAHRTVPDDLLAALQRVGITEWVIWRSGRHLFHLVDCADFAAAMRELDGDPVNQRWQEFMAGYVERFAEDPDGAAGLGLRHVWTLTEQAGTEGPA
ncbi:L-rhamnose mutarotase [Plantactinospora sp. WMMC1484]|uniref:L-rhamnose mutarotase n=1 Tax=Plantactinospora sp. WMMC1484 TaxID=3404122 RepID=UPI003BF4BB7F